MIEYGQNTSRVSDIYHQKFLYKLTVLSGGRDIWPWLLSCGLTRGSINRVVNHGNEPSGDMLRMLQRTANANIRWLDENRGSPFIVTKVVNDAEGMELIEALADEQWSVYWLEQGDVRCIVLTLPAEFEIKDRRLPYTVVEIITGNIGPMTKSRLTKAAHGRPVYQVNATPKELARLASGWMSNAELIGFEDGRKSNPGLLSRAEEITSGMPCAAEEPGSYRTKQTDPAGDELLLLFRRMSQSQQNQLLKIARALSEE